MNKVLSSTYAAPHRECVWLTYAWSQLARTEGRGFTENAPRSPQNEAMFAKEHRSLHSPPKPMNTTAHTTSNTSDLVVSSSLRGVTTLKMNMPSRLNGWTFAMMEALKARLEEAAQDEQGGEDVRHLEICCDCVIIVLLLSCLFL